MELSNKVDAVHKKQNEEITKSKKRVHDFYV